MENIFDLVLFKYQNVKVLDAIARVGQFDWDMTKEQSNCPENVFGWCNFYAGNFN